MKAMLIILIINPAWAAGITTVQVPIENYEYCLQIAEHVGKSVADTLGERVHSVSTECIQTSPIQ